MGTDCDESPPRCLIRVSKDGSKFEIIATGLRAPNGLGMGRRISSPVAITRVTDAGESH
jgi:hypothetical protein